MATRGTADAAAARRPVAPGLLVIGIEAFLAAVLFLFLTSESWMVTSGLLLAAGGGFLVLQRNPAIETRITEWFAAARTTAILFGGLLAVAFPVFIGSNTYVLHLLIVSALYAVLALA